MFRFLNAVVDGLRNVFGITHASITPFTVTTVKIEDYENLPVEAKDGDVILIKRPGAMEAMLSNKLVHKHYSIFRLTNETEALNKFRQFSSIINPLAHASSSVYDENLLQKISDIINMYPSWRPVHIAAYVGLYECFHDENFQCDVNHQVTKTLLSPLMTAVLGNNSLCVTVPLELGARLELQDEHGDTVYHHAVIHHPDVIPILVKHDNPEDPTKRAINYLNNKGLTALACACQMGKSQVVEMLLDGGADPNISAHDMFPIHFAIKMNDSKSVELICKRSQDNLSVEDQQYGGTALHWARNRQMVEKLCRQKADINAKSTTGHTPLHIMQMKDRKDCVMELLRWGADPNIGDEYENNTPLHTAVIKDDEEMVKIFMIFGADVNVQNRKNESPRHLASTSNGENKERILYMLHVSGALRCTRQQKNCFDGCFVKGINNGETDEHISEILDQDESGLLDEMLSSMCELPSQLDKSEKDSGYRVLSLDGGGIRGIVVCMLLIAIEKEAGKPTIDCFDWIMGTGIGGFLALEICAGKPLTYIRGLFLRLKEEMFTGSRPYPSKKFEAMLKQEFGEHAVMTDLKKPRAVVTGVQADMHPTKLHLFRTYEPTLPQVDVICQRHGHKNREMQSVKKKTLYRFVPPSEQKVWEAARASCAAPTYFKAFGPYIDTALDTNNPTLDLLTEIHEYNCGLKSRKETQLVRPIGVVVSLGTGQVPIRPTDNKNARGAKNFINVATMDDISPVDRSRAWSGMLGAAFYRFNPQISEVEMDEYDDKKLIQLMWETHCYIVANKDRIKRLALYL